MNKKLPKILGLFIIGSLVVVVLLNYRNISSERKIVKLPVPQDIANKYSPPPTGLITPSPSPKPLTFEELNNLYGPCTYLPVIFYHHIQNMDVAKANGQQNLTVATNVFISQMQYLKDKGYITLSSNALTDFFDKGIPVPKGSLILTFDDGYEDFYVNVLPILREFGFRAIMALPTGLVGNPGYLTWDEISQIANSGVEIVNHTWSHASLASNNTNLIQKEISTADDQLNQRGYNQNKVFVYPYGGDSNYAISLLQQKGYTMAFTTNPGSTLCKKQRYFLPRIRVGSASLASYGF